MGFEISPQYTQNYIPRNVLESTLTKDIYILVVQLESKDTKISLLYTLFTQIQWTGIHAILLTSLSGFSPLVKQE